jgi:hypothetical protein
MPTPSPSFSPTRIPKIIRTSNMFTGYIYTL